MFVCMYVCLLMYARNFSSLTSCSNGKLGTPLSCAAYHGHDHIVSCLLGRDVSCNGSYADLKVTVNYCLCAIYILYAKHLGCKKGSVHESKNNQQLKELISGVAKNEC